VQLLEIEKFQSQGFFQSDWERRMANEMMETSFKNME
jgi:hypothetical protein